MEIVMSDKISEKIRLINERNTTRDRKFLKDFALSIFDLKRKQNISKKVKGTQNIFVFKIGSRYRVFYTIERNDDGKEVILLLDYFDKVKYRDEKVGDLLKEFEEYNNA